MKSAGVISKEDKDLAKADDILEAMTQESEEKGADAVIEVQKEAEDREAVEKAMISEVMGKKSHGNTSVYMTALATIAEGRLKYVDWPKGYSFKVGLDGRKVSLIFTDKYGRKFGKGFVACGEHEYDLNAINVLSTQLENTVDYIEGRLAWQTDKQGKAGMYNADGSFTKFDDKSKDSTKGRHAKRRNH